MSFKQRFVRQVMGLVKRGTLVAAIRRCLGIVPASRANFHRLSVLHVTLMACTLRVALRFSNPNVQGIACSRHATKLWLQVYDRLWEHLHASLIWAGYVFRRGPSDLTCLSDARGPQTLGKGRFWHFYKMLALTLRTLVIKNIGPAIIY